MASADDPRVKKLLSFGSMTRGDLAVLVVTGTDKLEQLRAEREPGAGVVDGEKCERCGGNEWVFVPAAGLEVGDVFYVSVSLEDEERVSVKRTVVWQSGGTFRLKCPSGWEEEAEYDWKPKPDERVRIDCPDCHGTGKKPLPEAPRCGPDCKQLTVVIPRKLAEQVDTGKMGPKQREADEAVLLAVRKALCGQPEAGSVDGEELTDGEQEFAARRVVISFCEGPLDGLAGFAPDTRPIQLGEGTYRFVEADPEDGAVYEWGPTFYPAPWQCTPEPRPDDDSFELCGNCGGIAHDNRWQGFTRDEETDQLVPYNGDDEAPFWRCPDCQFDHTDDDADPATYGGTLEEMLGQRRDLIREGYVLDAWREFTPAPVASAEPYPAGTRVHHRGALYSAADPDNPGGWGTVKRSVEQRDHTYEYEVEVTHATAGGTAYREPQRTWWGSHHIDRASVEESTGGEQ